MCHPRMGARTTQKVKRRRTEVKRLLVALICRLLLSPRGQSRRLCSPRRLPRPSAPNIWSRFACPAASFSTCDGRHTVAMAASVTADGRSACLLAMPRLARTLTRLASRRRPWGTATVELCMITPPSSTRQAFFTSSTPAIRAIRIVSCRARISAHFGQACS